MRILYICPDFPTFSRGGQTFHLLSEIWGKGNNDVTVITTCVERDCGGVTKYNNFTVNFYEISSLSRLFPEATIFFPLRLKEKVRLISFLRKYSDSYDIILIHGLLETIPRICLKYIRRKERIILTNHGLSLGSFSPVVKIFSSIFYLVLGGILIRHTNYITYYSDYVIRQQNLFFGNLSGRKKKKIALGIDTSMFHEFPGGLNLTESYSNGPFLFSVGRNVKIKGFDILLKSFYHLKKRFPKLRLVIAGKKTNYTDKLISLAVALKINGFVEFVDYITEEEKLRLISNASVFVIPSLSEGYGLNAIFARIFSVPTIATDTGNHKEILDGNAKAIVVKPGSVKELTRGIISLLANLDNKDRTLNWEIIDKYDIKNTANEYITLFEKVLADQ